MKNVYGMSMQKLEDYFLNIGQKKFKAIQVYEWLYKYTVESGSYVIIDEYDEVISFEDFIKMVEDKQLEENPDNFKYNKNVNGYRFADGEFS